MSLTALEAFAANTGALLKHDLQADRNTGCGQPDTDS